MPIIRRGKINLNHIYLFFCLLVAFRLGAINGYKITLKSNLKEHKVYLWYVYGENQYPLDTGGTNAEGTAVFEKTHQLTGGVFVLYLTADKALEILLTDENTFTINIDTTDIIGKTNFTGSKENSIYYDFLRKIKFNEFQEDALKMKLKNKNFGSDSVIIIKNMIFLYQQQNDLLENQTIEKNKNTFVASLLKAGSEIEVPKNIKPNEKNKWAKDHFFDNVNFADERLAYSPVLFNKYREYINDYIYHEGDSMIVACDTILKKSASGKENFKWSLYFLSSSFEQSAVPGQDKVFVHLVDEYYSKYKTWWVTQDQLSKMQRHSDILRNLFIGAVCPDFTATDSSGKEVNLHKQINKLTVLYFWSYDCHHCLEETPKLAAWMKKHPEINLISACATPDEDKWKEKLKEFKMPGTHLIDPEMKANFIHIYNIFSTPEIFVIDKNKKILAKYLSDTKELEEFLKTAKIK